MKVFALFARSRRRRWALAALVVTLGLLAAYAARQDYLARHGRVAVLNRLRDEINAAYGYLDGYPRVNAGPCGRFAKAFREQWNARFSDQIVIAFVMTQEGECCHVLVKFPDGSYFDGGNGVMSEQELLAKHSDCRIDAMVDFDPNLLDVRSGGLNRHYARCPNYSDDVTGTIISKYLALLPQP